MYFRLNSFEERMFYLISKYPSVPIFILAQIILLFVLMYYDNYMYHTGVILVIIALIQYISSIISLELKRNLRLKGSLDKSNEHFEMFITIGFRLLYLVVIWTTIEVQRVKYEKRYINTEIEFSDLKFKSDSMKFYIGHTNNYIFMHDLNTNQTTIRFMRDVRQLRFGNINYIPEQLPKKPLDSLNIKPNLILEDTCKDY